MKNYKLLISGISVAAALVLSGCANTGLEKKESNNTNVLTTYATIATTNYNEALNDAKSLQNAINTFVQNPTEKTLQQAKDAWKQARETYGQTEIFRLSNGPIDAEEGWVEELYGAKEGQVNAWPLDENMIDYTIDANGKRTSGNIIDTIGKFNPGGEESQVIDVTTITKEALSALNENGGEANVSTGYHAIEFLLWGQDQDYSNFIKDSVTHGDMTAGQRPLSDYTKDKFAHRRAQYLNAVTEKLVDDLSVIASAWENQVSGTKGLYKAALLNRLDKTNSDKNMDEKSALKQIFAGMGVFIKSELANERIAVAVLTPSEEDEHSCFSDNTHRDIAMNYQGFKNVLLGEYEGKKLGQSPLDALKSEERQRVLNLMASIEEKIASINYVATTSRHFDRQIISTDPQSKVIVKLKNQMRKLGDEMINVARANGINLSVDDVTDAEETKI